MGETFLSLLAPRSLSAPPCEPSVQGGPGAPGVNAGPRPWTEGHGGLAQAELMGARPVGWPRGVREVEAGGGVWSSAWGVEARMPLGGRRMDSEGLTGLGWHWSTPRTF